ncbi:hypothetical protein L9F63_000309, partial [Diploptera punctata]
YREKCLELSRIYQDQPISPMDQAVFWTEYVIRHKGAPHMRSAALDLTWYQYFLLDVLAVFILLIFSITITIKKDFASMKGASTFALLLFFTLKLNVVLTANILSFFIVYPESHRIIKSTLLRELAARGHSVTVVSPTKEDPLPNYEDIIVNDSLEFGKVFDVCQSCKYFVISAQFARRFLLFLITMVFSILYTICKLVLENSKIQELIHSEDRHYDLIILEAYYSDCFLAFSKKFNAPVIKVSLYSGAPWMYDWIGNPTELSHVPDPYVDYTHKMTFTQRVWNVLTTSFHYLGRKFYYLPNMNFLMRKYINNSENFPSLWELEAETTSLVLFNSHFSISYPRPLLPNAIQMGGMHIKPPNKLPQDIQTYLDEAKHGVIYFSIGSILSSAYFPEPIKKAFLEAFSKLKEKVLWKWETESLPGKPNNVKIGKWLPQADILAHPNVRVFMSHGGQMSTLEAIDRGVPMIGIPFFGDQFVNVARATAAGIGVTLEFRNISAESVTWALREVLDNPKYRENMQKLSRIFRDQPLPPLEQAVFWTEYVIRHKGAPHMRSAALDLTWYQKFVFHSYNVFQLTNILSFFIVYPESHRIIKSTLLRELVARGHSVTVVSPTEEEPLPNYEDIIVNDSLELGKGFGKCGHLP